MNVLIVDDEVSFRLLVKDYLVDEGFTVVLAENGEEGIEKLRKEKIDIVISDLHMHGMDGIKFCSVAREIPRFQSIPYLFVSAYGDEHTFGLLSSLKNSAFLSKGRPMNELVAMIHHLTTPVDQGGGFSPSDVPMEPSTKETQAREASTNDTISKNKSPEHSRILVVDDDEAFRILLSDMLGREGYVVITASDGQEAIELVRNQSFDLVLLDIVMPNVSGFGVLMFIKENAPSIKVIMLTAYSELKLAVECKEFGADDFIGKPFMRPDLLNTIKKVLSG